jgi:hypothetical protein
MSKGYRPYMPDQDLLLPLSLREWVRGRALRTETVICNPDDFEIGRRVCAQNWNALRAVGRPILGSRARYTSPMPPAPMGARIS